jgi:hypothetical protein
MKLPSLNKVFLIKEANATNIAQATKLPLAFADNLNKAFPKDAFHIAKYIRLTLKDTAIKSLVEAGYTPDELVGFFGHLPDALKYPKFKKYIESLPVSNFSPENAENVKVQAHDALNQSQAGQFKKDVTIEFSDGSFWHKLVDKKHKEREGKLMHNCVGTNYCPVGDIYSYKDLNGNPLIDVLIVPSTHSIKQIQGPRNNDFDEKYTDKVVQFLKAVGPKYGNDLKYWKEETTIYKNGFAALKQAGIKELNDE